jgi:biopolymer transport protein ExbD
MPRVKVQRKSTAIDMTAMCDVAFLLLTFFILTAKPRTEDPVPVDIPASSITQPIPDDNVLMLTVAEQKVFFTVDGNDIRKQTLNKWVINMVLSLQPKSKPSSRAHQYLAYL